MAGAQATSAAPRPVGSPWHKAGMRIASRVVWLPGTALKWTTHFRAVYIDHLTDGSERSSGSLYGWFRYRINLRALYPLSVGYYLEQRIGWWHRVAAVGRRNHHPEPALVSPHAVPQSPTLTVATTPTRLPRGQRAGRQSRI